MKKLGSLLGLSIFAYLLVNSVFAFQRIAQGTGDWWGEYSLKWAVGFLAYILFCVLLVTLAVIASSSREFLQPAAERMVAVRNRLGLVRWFIFLIVILLPVWLFQYTPWGIVFRDVHLRILFWFLTVMLLAFLMSSRNVFMGWNQLLTVTLLTSSAFVISVSFINVSDHPFSLGWSEGNRLWDYSMMFGSERYAYPADQEVYVLLDFGRQFIGGVPFIFPGLTIWMERFWLSLTAVVPYLLLGLAAFRLVRPDLRIWMLTTLWVLVFLKQGPIHTPLVLCAVAVALLWRRPLWLAIPLIALTGYIAEESRFTWIFAPGMWIGMLELAGAPLQDGKKLTSIAWVRAIVLGLSGMAGGQFGQKIAGMLAGNAQAPAATSVSSAVSMVSNPSDPLLWYRLLPNETYDVGILFGLLLAIFPLIVMLIYMIATKKWTLNMWQALSIVAPLLAFLAVGLIVSTKIGGGGDLHNMDMFLIGLVFVALLAWEKDEGQLLKNSEGLPTWMKIILVLFFALPGLQSLRDMRSYDFGNEVPWLLTLSDLPDQKFLEMRPSDEVTDRALNIIREQVALAHEQGGEVLFMDQRQLLTFGYVMEDASVPEYEKKILMQQALGDRDYYFDVLYEDLAAHRFALIISEPLRTPIKDSSFEFGEENNAWVKWVAEPILCYYEPLETFKQVNVQLLVPKHEPVDCSAVLP